MAHYNNMKIKSFCLLFLSLCLNSLYSKQPNILFIFTDDHALNAISAYGGPLSKIAPTPHLDRIAKEGMMFNNCLVTNSICAPSRAVVLTGKYLAGKPGSIQTVLSHVPTQGSTRKMGTCPSSPP